jgi:hypothetical protein
VPGQTELRPVRGGCRHLRARYKVQQHARSPFPDLELIRYECEQARKVETDEDTEKCMESLIKCWQEEAQ